jgi:hypothetical protein
VLDPGQNVWLYYDPNRNGGRWTAAITAQKAGGITQGVASSGVVGGSSVCLTTTLTLTDAQIRAGGTYTILAAGGTGVANIPIRAYARMTRSNTSFMSGNLTGTVRYTGETDNLLSSTLSMNYASSGDAATKHVITEGGNYDGGWGTSTSRSPLNKAIELNVAGGPITGSCVLGFDLVLFYVQATL